ncbi:MAG: hypothetical protein ACRC31_02425, partial [Cetobacterium sp.]
RTAYLLSIHIFILSYSFIYCCFSQDMAVNNSQLRDEVKQLKDKIEGDESFKTNSEHQYHTDSHDGTSLCLYF